MFSRPVARLDPMSPPTRRGRFGTGLIAPSAMALAAALAAANVNDGESRATHSRAQPGFGESLGLAGADRAALVAPNRGRR